MKIVNIEFKARAADINRLEKMLLECNPLFKGEDHQVDTYYNVPQGRLKLRVDLPDSDYVHFSYSDLLIEKNQKGVNSRLSG